MPMCKECFESKEDRPNCTHNDPIYKTERTDYSKYGVDD